MSDYIRIERTEWERLLGNLEARDLNYENAQALAGLVTRITYVLESLQDLGGHLGSSDMEANRDQPGVNHAHAFCEAVAPAKDALQEILREIMSGRDNVIIGDVIAQLRAIDLGLGNRAVTRTGVPYAFGDPSMGHPPHMSNSEMCARRRGDLGGVVTRNGLPVIYFQAARGGAWYLVPPPGSSLQDYP